MIIAFDLDDTLLAFMESIRKFHNEEYASKLAASDFNSYDFWEVWGGTKEEAIVKVDKFFETEHFDEIKVLEGAREFLDELKKKNELYIITARPVWCAQKTRNQVDFHFPDTFRDVHFSDRYGMNGDCQTKRMICDKLKVDVLIEDSAGNANDCVSNHRRVFLFNKPWNIHIKTNPRVVRVDSWVEITSALNKTPSFCEN